MSSEDEDMDSAYRPDTPEEVVSKAALWAYYSMLKTTFKSNDDLDITSFSKLNDFLKYKSASLWAYYSMLKTTFKSNDDLDITSFSKLNDFLKYKSAGYKSEKPKMFTEEEIEKFINEAPDDQWLHVKVFCIFAAGGAYKSSKLTTVMVDHIKQYDNLLLLTIPKTGMSEKCSFTITGTYFNIVQKYAALRPPNPTTDRFFWRYENGKCRKVPIGKNQFSGMARKIAKYLKLPQPERYSSSSYRIRLASISANTNAWNPNSAAEESVEHLLDFETGLLKTPSVSHSVPSVSVAAASNRNLNRRNGNATHKTNGNSTNNTNGHVCAITCFQAQCAMEENEQSALHAFTIFKPADYTITEVTAAKFASDPICRWIVAYTHNTEPVSSYNADETFDDITRTTPLNVRVVQKYIRSNSSQLLAGYVVVYGVNCRCYKESSEMYSFSVNEIKCET